MVSYEEEYWRLREENRELRSTKEAQSRIIDELLMSLRTLRASLGDFKHVHVRDNAPVDEVTSMAILRHERKKHESTSTHPPTTPPRSGVSQQSSGGKTQA